MLASYFLKNRPIPQLGRTPGVQKTTIYNTCLVFKSRRNTDLRNHPGVRSVQQGRRASARRLHARQAGQRGQRSWRQCTVAMVMMVVRSGGEFQAWMSVNKGVLLLLLLRLHWRVQGFCAVAMRP